MNGKRSLVIYYSLEGNTKLIAETIAEAVQGELLELKPIKDVQPTGFMRYVWGGKQVIFKNKPALQPLDKNPQEYDQIFLGTPVWAGTYAPALNSFFAQVPLTGKEVALFCCYGGQPGRTYESIKKAIPQNQFIGEIGLKDPKTHEQQAQLERVRQWAATMSANL